VHAVTRRLGEAAASPLHEFWPDDVSLLDERIAHSARIHGPRQIADLYLLALALAVRHGGQFVTFDASVPLDAVKRAEKKHLLVL
jgi:predicted nucleic acid-binding protein